MRASVEATYLFYIFVTRFMTFHDVSSFSSRIALRLTAQQNLKWKRGVGTTTTTMTMVVHDVPLPVPYAPRSSCANARRSFETARTLVGVAKYPT